METFVLTIHIITSVLLILLVLVQSGKGAEAGAMFGGVSQTVFGSEGGSILTKTTTILAVIFMLTSISLTVMQNKAVNTSVLDNTSVVEHTTQTPKTTK